jgi:Protein of unknown function (DUF3761)
MFRSLYVVVAIVGSVTSTAVLVRPMPVPGLMANSPYGDCLPGFYRGSSGDCVPDPNNSDASVTAICRDGAHSHSEHRTGTCSGHGGVAQWCPCNFSSGQPNAQLPFLRSVRDQPKPL